MTCRLQRFDLLRKITPPFVGVVRGQTYIRPAQREVIGLSRDIHPTQATGPTKMLNQFQLITSKELYSQSHFIRNFFQIQIMFFCELVMSVISRQKHFYSIKYIRHESFSH